ncbi:sulfite exporter TauE/SafE family protein [Limibacter armeniacum]|uniref:sulfite exporter TauE/SafE family protein n=1 Tax=Limibacter armeniacum TaxID=466084 RepID=UPI002FE62FC3
MENLFEMTAYVLAGVVAGLVNTLAGGGSIFTLSLLFFLGMPAHIANGTNRLGILVQNISGSYTFQKSGLLDIQASMHYVVPSLIGALVGASVATDIEADLLEMVVGGLMIFMLVGVLFEPKQKKNMVGVGRNKNHWLQSLFFLGVGFYGGFVQAGIGILIIVAFSFTSSIGMIRSNAIKMLIIAIYSLPVFCIFIYKGQVAWLAAILLAVGQLIGTWVAGKYVAKRPGVNKLVKWVLVVMILATIFKTFGVFAILPI